MFVRAVAVPLALAAAVATAACGRTPTTPTPIQQTPQAAYEGVWRVDYRVTACSGERHCFAFMGETRQAVLRLTRTGNTFEGTATVVGQAVSVSGAVDATGDLVLSGRRPHANPTDVEMEISEFRLHATATGASGRIEYALRGTPNGFFFGDARYGGEVIAAARVADTSGFNVTQFAGLWVGRFVVRDCGYVGWLWCYPHRADETHTFRLTLTQSGTDVSGMLELLNPSMPVTGTVSGDTLELRGSTTQVISGGSEVARLTSWSTRRDLVGRMTGTFAFTIEWPGIGDGTRLYSTTYRRVELDSTALMQEDR